MDALRKAEEAKRSHANTTETAENAQPESSAALELEPLGNATDLNEPAFTPPSAGASPEPFTPPPIVETPPPTFARSEPSLRTTPRPAVSTPDPVQRESVNNLFAAKQSMPNSNTFALVATAIAVIGVISIGAYVWWQMQPKSPTLVANKNLPVVTAPLPPLPVQVAPPPAAPLEIKPVFAANPVNDSDKVLSARIEPAPPPPPASPIRIVRSTARVNPLTSQAYDALQQGNLVAAQQSYERLLNAEPKNADALYGLAAIALQNNRPDLAEDYYLRILESDPRDAVAHAGLIGLHGKANGSNAESRLKTLIAEQPNIGALHFALGNIYAAENRWREAQQAYFLAYKNESDTPDIVFNLAISLDHLHQDKLAAQYYNEALRLAATRPSGFNRNQIQLRLRELQAQ
jgi:Flp pilus assembly protein TadD